MKLAIMQPYLFPYLGYFQLIHSVDRFVVYDDVAYIKGGWINRNNVLVSGQRHLFTLPLKGASPNLKIREVQLDTGRYPSWVEKFRRTLRQSYAKAPQLAAVETLLDEALPAVPPAGIAELDRRALQIVCDYLGITTELVESATCYDNDHLTAQARVLDICRREGATTYVNAIGGVSLYDDESFDAAGVELRFLRSLDAPYDQRRSEFVPHLSVIDALMYNDRSGCRDLLGACELVERRAVVAADGGDRLER